MRVCVVGAGAIGGYVAARFAQAGIAVTVVARGRNFEALTQRGLRLTYQDGTEILAPNVRVVANLREAGPHDVVVLGMKAHQVEAVADDLPAAIHAESMIVPMQNGIPWWYFQRHGGPHAGRAIASVDPTGKLLRTIDPERIIGCVVYPATELAAPGWIRHIEGDRFPLGEIEVGKGVASTPRIEALSALFVRAGLKAPVIEDIRAEIWLKLWGNLTFNPISALAHSTLVDICQFPLSRELAVNMMREAEAVATQLGITFRVPLEKRIAGAERVGKHKTSMLQDVEAGRDPEVDALVGAVIELGKITHVPTPHISAIFALMKLLSRTITADRVSIRAQSAAQVA